MQKYNSFSADSFKQTLESLYILNQRAKYQCEHFHLFQTKRTLINRSYFT